MLRHMNYGESAQRISIFSRRCHMYVEKLYKQVIDTEKKFLYVKLFDIDTKTYN